MLNMQLKGAQQVHQLLQQLPVEVETKILRSALAKGARVIRDEARRLAPDDTGELRKGIKTSRDTKQGRVIAKVKLTGDHAFLGRFYEYGTREYDGSIYKRKARRDPKTGRYVTNRGKQVQAVKGSGALVLGENMFGLFPDKAAVKKRPFMRPAADAKTGEAMAVIGEHFAKYLSFGAIQAPQIEFDEAE